MRDRFTISSHHGLLENGHLVFGTLHTNGDASTINRVIDRFPTDRREKKVRVQLGGQICLAVLSQCLCREWDTPIKNTTMVAGYEFMYVTTGGIQNLIRGKKRAFEST